MIEKKYKIFVSAVAAVFMLVCGGAGNVYAQMFSVGETETRYGSPMSEIVAGVEFMDATYKGGPNLEGAGAFEYDGRVLMVGYNSPGLNLYLSAGGKITGIDNVSYFHTGGNFDFGINLHRSSTFNVKVPLRIASRYTNITNNRSMLLTTGNRFQFGMIAVGGGINAVWRPAKNVRVEVGAVPTYGFSFATGGFFGGSIGSVNAHGKLYFDRLFDDKGLSIGYKYDLRNYDIEEDVYDYSLKGHSIELGITF